MPVVELENAEWQQVMNALIAQNPLLMKIGAQLQAQQQPPVGPMSEQRAGNSKEAHHG